MTKYNQDLNIPPVTIYQPSEHMAPPGMEIHRRIPAREPTIRADVGVPFLWSLVSGLFVFLFAATIALASEQNLWLPLALATLAAGGIWFALLVNWKKLLWATEDITHTDLDHDGYVGEPPQDDVEITIRNEDEPGAWRYLSIPADTFPKLPALATALMDGTPFSENALCGKGRPLTRSEFQNLRDIFFARGVCEWKDKDHHTLGIRFTAYGRSVMRQFADLGTTPARIRTHRLPDAPRALEAGEGDSHE